MRYVLLICLFFSSWALALDFEINPQAMTEQAARHGWPKLIESVFADYSASNQFLLAVDSGNKDWLEMAISIYQKSDNIQIKAQVLSAIGEAVQWNPQQVFEQIQKQVPIDQVCGAGGFYEWRKMSPFLLNQAIKRRRQALKSLNSFSLQRPKQQCLKTLELVEKSVNQIVSP